MTSYDWNNIIFM